MYPFEEVYPNKLEEVCLDLVLLGKFEKMRAQKEELKKKKELELQMAKTKLVETPRFDLPKMEKPTHVQATIPVPTNLLNMIKMDHSINNTTMTVHTKEAMNVVQDMWNSPTPNQARPRQLFGGPQTPEEVASYPKPVDENAPPFGHQPTAAPVSRKLFTVYTEEDEEDGAAGAVGPQPSAPLPAKLSLSSKGKTPLGERSEGRGAAPIQEDQLADRFQTKLQAQPLPRTPQWQPFQDKNDDFSDVTCNTKAFDFVLPSSTPVNKRNFSSAERVEDNTVKKAQSENLTNLSVIYEASKERCSTTDSNSSGSVHPKTPRSAPRIGVSEGFDPFSPKTIEELLDLVNFPKAFQYENYFVRNSNVPNMTKIVKVADIHYTILGDIGKGVYARVLKASRGNEIVALKLEKPACKWEFYVAKEIQRRRGPSNMKLLFMDIRAAHIYNNGSILEIDYAKYGTLVDIINLHKKKTGNRLEFGVVVHYAIELLDIVDYLHKCKIIHADLKPDNIVIRELPAYKESEPCIQLIDFGRCIDMSLLPPDTQFHCVFKTEDNKCNEMKENKPWTYQIDLYGLASIFHCLLSGEYMKVVKKNNRWTLQKPIPRNMRREQWNPIFDALLNVDSCEDLPMSLAPIRASLVEAMEASIHPCLLNIQSFNNVISNST